MKFDSNYFTFFDAASEAYLASSRHLLKKSAEGPPSRPSISAFILQSNRLSLFFMDSIWTSSYLVFDFTVFNYNSMLLALNSNCFLSVSLFSSAAALSDSWDLRLAISSIICLLSVSKVWTLAVNSSDLLLYCFFRKDSSLLCSFCFPMRLAVFC